METTAEQKRGQLTQRIRDKSKELLGYEIPKTEFRLMPYVHYQLVNEQRLKPEHLDEADKAILAKWVNKGYILNGATGCGRPMISKGEKLKVTKEFWNILNEIIFLGYVDLDDF